MSTERRLSIMKQLFMTYPNVSAGPETIAMYLRLTGDIPEDALQVAIDQCISGCKFLPTIAEIRETWLTATLPAVRGWAEAWDEVQQQMRKVGYVGTPRFSDELTERVVKSFGWRTLCASENTSTDRAQFRDMYTQLAQRQHEVSRMLPATKELALKANAVPRLTDGEL